ncbi:site-specific integrase [Streptomyces sp. NPDC051162]|uniref:site-specific integrase n=1 Tax=Streptomyces sp. NPDC051162 TaxID=3154747 RepID=UPI00344457B8
MTIAQHQPRGGISPFAGADVCTEAGLQLPAGVVRPAFDEDLWDFTHVDGLPVSMSLASRRFTFAAITDSRWRLVAKELVLAMLAPCHPAVVALPRAHRNVMHLASCFARLDELTRFFTWLNLRGLTSLGQVDTRVCEAYLAHRRYVLDEEGTVVGERSPGTRRAAAQVVVDLVNYRDLFTADSVPDTLRPWGGATASAIAEMPSGREQNTTRPVDDAIMQPMLAAALYLVDVLGPHAVALAREVRESDQALDRKSTQWPMPHRTPVTEFQTRLLDLEQAGTPLPKIENHRIAMRLADGWDPQDPLLPLATGILARQAGVRQWHSAWMPDLRGLLENAAASVGVEPPLARRAAPVISADGASTLPWTLPLHRSEAVALVGIVRTATIIVIAAASGMRASELMELRLGCRRPPEELVPGLVRYRIASKVIKGQPLGGTADQWIVIEPVYRAIALAELLHEAPADGAPLFGRFAFSVRYKWFRKWVTSDAAGRLGLAAVPEGPVNLRMLRRTLALEMAYRPGGVLATKIHLKHISVATTEGYADPRELHQTGEKSQVASSWRGPDQLRGYYDLAA